MALAVMSPLLSAHLGLLLDFVGKLCVKVARKSALSY